MTNTFRKILVNAVKNALLKKIQNKHVNVLGIKELRVKP